LSVFFAFSKNPNEYVLGGAVIGHIIWSTNPPV